MAHKIANNGDGESFDVKDFSARKHKNWVDPKFQAKTFTRWVNVHLSSSGEEPISQLETDFSDGVKLIKLAEALSGKSVGRYCKKTTFRSQQLENISLAINFLEEEEHIKLVNIDGSAIADGNMKLILGLIWTLIFHYSIARVDYGGGGTVSDAERPKEKLMNWIKRTLPSKLPFTNFTSDWNDGILLGALVGSLVPDCPVGWQEWLPGQALQSTRKAMDIAEDHLHVYPLITAEELINPEVDEKSVMTYLSQFPKAKYVSPLSRILQLDRSPHVGIPTTFTIQLRDEEVVPEFSIKDADGESVVCEMRQLTPTTFEAKYTPKKAGIYVVACTLRNKPTSTSYVQYIYDNIVAVKVDRPILECTTDATINKPYIMTLKNPGSEKLQIMVTNPRNEQLLLSPTESKQGQYTYEFTPTCTGLHSITAVIGQKILSDDSYKLDVKPRPVEVWSRVYTKEGIRVNDKLQLYAGINEADQDAFNVHVIGPSGAKIPVTKSVTKDNRMMFQFSPTAVGEYELQILSMGRHIEKSPFKFEVLEASASCARAFGPGLKDGIVETECAFFVVSESSQNIGLSIEGPCKPEVRISKPDGETTLVKFTPHEPGTYYISIKDDNEHIKDSPFCVRVEPQDKRHILSSATLSMPPKADVYADEDVQFTLNALSEPLITVLNEELRPQTVSVKRSAANEYICSFEPSSSGRYYIFATVDDVIVPGSPIMVNVRSKDSMKAVIVRNVESGHGITHHLNFDIKVGSYDLQSLTAYLVAEDGTKYPAKLSSVNNDTVAAECDIAEPGRYELVAYQGNVVRSKVAVNVRWIPIHGICDNERLKVGSYKEFTIDIGDLESDGLKAILKDDTEQEIHLEKVYGTTGVYKGVWKPIKPGEVTLTFTYDQKPCSTYRLIVVEPQDASKCLVYGDGLERAEVGENATFIVDMRNAGDGKLSVVLTGPSESESRVFDNEDGTCTAEYTPKLPGLYEINVLFGDEQKQVPGAPFCAAVDYKVDPSKIKVSNYVRDVQAGVPLSMIVDASETAYKPIDACLPVGFQQPIVKEIKPRIYEVTFTPVRFDIDNFAMELLYGGQFLKKLDFTMSPKEVVVKEEEKCIPAVKLEGQLDDNANLEVPACYDCVLQIRNTPGCTEDPEVIIEGPYGRQRIHSFRRTKEPGVYELKFFPNAAGIYTVTVICGDNTTTTEVIAKPDGRASLCKILNSPPDVFCTIGQQQTYTISAPDSIKSKLHVWADRENKGEIDTFITSKGGGVHEIGITPHALGPHNIRVLMGGEVIPNGLLQIECIPSPGDVAEVLEREKDFDEIDFDGRSGGLRRFIFRTSNPQIEKFAAVVITPTGDNDNPIVTVGDDGIVITYLPRMIGHHILYLQENGINVAGSPVSFFVKEKAESVAIYGKGLTRGVVGVPCTFTVFTGKYHTALLRVAVEGTAEAKITFLENDDGTCTVTWIPVASGDYKIYITVGEESAKGSPFTAHITGEVQKKLSTESSLTYDGFEKITHEAIEPIFRGDARKVMVDGSGLHRFFPSETASFSVDTRLAGENLLFVGIVTLKGPCEEVTVRHVGDGRYLVKYRIQERVKGYIYVKYGDEQVPGSPFPISY